jgi:hypothetical protein
VDSIPTALREAPNLTKMNMLRIGVGDLIEAFYLAKQGAQGAPPAGDAVRTSADHGRDRLAYRTVAT